MTRLALVGFGWYGMYLAQRIWEMQDKLGCRLVAAADARGAQFPDKVKELRDHGAEVYDDALKMFAQLQGKCDGMYIATGIASHAFLTTAAVKAGFHIHLEKPPAATVQDCDQMQAVLDDAGKFCLVGFNFMHSNDMQFIKDLVVTGKLGQVKTIITYAGSPRDAEYYARTDWAGKLRWSNNWVLDGPATNALAHQVQAMLFLASAEPKKMADPIAARAELYAANNIEAHDTVSMEVRTAQGPSIFFHVSHATQEFFGPTMVIQGTKGKVVWEMRKSVTATFADNTTQTLASDELYGQKMIVNFVQALQANDGSLLRCPLREARKMVLALDGLHESSGRIHRIDSKFFRRLEAGTPKERLVVDGLDQLIRDAAAKGVLLSDLPSAPAWMKATKEFDLAGYSSFPQRFKAE